MRSPNCYWSPWKSNGKTNTSWPVWFLWYRKCLLLGIIIFYNHTYYKILNDLTNIYVGKLTSRAFLQNLYHDLYFEVLFNYLPCPKLDLFFRNFWHWLASKVGSWKTYRQSLTVRALLWGIISLSFMKIKIWPLSTLLRYLWPWGHDLELNYDPF